MSKMYESRRVVVGTSGTSKKRFLKVVEITVRIDEKDRTQKIPINDFDPVKHILLGNSVIISFSRGNLRRMSTFTRASISGTIGCCGFYALERHVGENISAVNPGADVPVVLLDEPFNCWYPKVNLAVMDPPEYKEEAA